MSISTSDYCWLLLPLIVACSRPERDKTNVRRGLDAWPVSELNETPKVAAKTPKDSIASNWEDGYLLLSWKILAQVTFDWEFSGELQAEVPIPNFSEAVQALEGQPVQIKGYVIPMGDPDAPFTVLSANPYKQCFFCGGAGPETVMDVLLKDGEKRHFDMDETTVFRGRLKLNRDDFDYLNYILEDAEVVD
ncbi:DUF3299 domain-containing protein [Phaeodactylibacter xiamenensis]|uniref:DUF3299 domain-containing protein n=1 Tax=Phaeodactylibacter xiamenensis TaxID=1524460 RepID=UPI003BAC4573